MENKIQERFFIHMKKSILFFVFMFFCFSFVLSGCTEGEDPIDETTPGPTEDTTDDLPVYQQMYLEGGENDPNKGQLNQNQASHIKLLNLELEGEQEYDELGYLGVESIVVVVLKGPKYDTFTDLVLSDSHYSTQCIYTATSTNYVVESVNIDYVESEEMYYTVVRINLPKSKELGLRTIEIIKINFIRELISEQTNLEAIIDPVAKTTIIFNVTLRQDLVVSDHENNLYYYYDETLEGLVVDGPIIIDQENEQSFVIPESFMGFPILEIGDNAFEGLLLSEVTLPEGLLRIGNRAFAYTTLTSIVIPSTVTDLESEAFSATYKHSPRSQYLTTVTFAENSQLFAIRYAAFAHHQLITSIEIPQDVYIIDQSAFENTSLNEIFIPANVIYIKDRAFYDVRSLEMITFEEGSHLKQIGDEAFTNVNLIENLVIPSTVETIGYRAFYGASSLESLRFEDDSELTSIGSSAFEGALLISSLVIPKKVMNLGQYFIRNTPQLSDVSFEETSMIEEIGTYSFSGLSGFTSITIPATVKVIGRGAFYQNGTVSNILFEPGSQLEVISDDAFNEASRLEGIEIYATVISIGNRAFLGTKIAYVNFEEDSQLTSIGEQAFLYSHHLVEIEIPRSVEVIGDEAFGNNSKLARVTFESNSKLESISKRMFYEAIALETIVIPKSVTSIGDYAFYGAYQLTHIEFEEDSSLISIGIQAFTNCMSIETLVIPYGVTTIGNYAFMSMIGLRGLYIPSSVTKIGEGAVQYNNEELIIYVEAISKPSGWNVDWNPDERTVVWGYVE
jgi:hypothetical protein